MNMIFHLTIPNLGLKKIHDGKLFSTLPNIFYVNSMTQRCWNRGCYWSHWHPQLLADKLTLFQLEADSAHPFLLVAPQHFFNFRHPCGSIVYVPLGSPDHFHLSN